MLVFTAFGIDITWENKEKFNMSGAQLKERHYQQEQLMYKLSDYPDSLHRLLTEGAFIQENKIIGYYKHVPAVEENKPTYMKLGKFLRKIFPNHAEWEIKEMVESYNIEGDPYELFTYKGEEIPVIYSLLKNSILSACMSKDFRFTYPKLDLYTQNPNNIQLCCMYNTHSQKMIARALIWYGYNEDIGKYEYFLDRVYGANKHKFAFRRKIKQKYPDIKHRECDSTSSRANGYYKIAINKPRHFIGVDESKYNGGDYMLTPLTRIGLPYCDTMPYYRYEGDNKYIVSNILEENDADSQASIRLKHCEMELSGRCYNHELADFPSTIPTPAIGQIARVPKHSMLQEMEDYLVNMRSFGRVTKNAVDKAIEEWQKILDEHKLVYATNYCSNAEQTNYKIDPLKTVI